jgi:hypothetical protein
MRYQGLVLIKTFRRITCRCSRRRFAPRLNSTVRPQVTTAVELQESLAELKDLELGNVEFGPFHLTMRLYGEWDISVRIDRAIELITPNGSYDFDHNSKQGEASGILLRLIRQRVQKLSYDPELFTISFECGTSVCVPLSAQEVDPLQIDCSHHMSPSQLAWAFIINAHM